MGELHEIVDVPTIERLFALLALLLPIGGLLIGAALGSRRGAARRGAGLGLLAGLFGPLNWILWRIYSAITDHLGLDSVKNVFVNLALFVALGALLGLGLRRVRGLQPPPHEPAPPSEPTA